MKAEARREQILSILAESTEPINGTELARQLQVSRQIIVSDIAILRANGNKIYSTNAGYLMEAIKQAKRVFKVQHTDEETEEELQLFVDFGGAVEDVFVYHKIYGVIRADLNIRSRLDVANYMKALKSGASSLLKNVTSGYHYHTVVADSEETLDLIQESLETHGFLAKLQDYEPVAF